MNRGTVVLYLINWLKRPDVLKIILAAWDSSVWDRATVRASSMWPSLWRMA